MRERPNIQPEIFERGGSTQPEFGRLVGHGSKAMLYDAHGMYKEGLEKGRDKILNYLGEDFLGNRKQEGDPYQMTFGESLVKVAGPAL